MGGENRINGSQVSRNAGDRKLEAEPRQAGGVGENAMPRAMVEGGSDDGISCISKCLVKRNVFLQGLVSLKYINASPLENIHVGSALKM